MVSPDRGISIIMLGVTFTNMHLKCRLQNVGHLCLSQYFKGYPIFQTITWNSSGIGLLKETFILTYKPLNKGCVHRNHLQYTASYRKASRSFTEISLLVILQHSTQYIPRFSAIHNIPLQQFSIVHLHPKLCRIS